MYHFYINDELLPLPPERLLTRIGSTNKVINLVHNGDFNILKDIGLTDFQFDIFLPALPTTIMGVLTSDDFNPPGYYLDKFREYKTNKEHIRFIIVRNTTDTYTNLLVSFEDYTIREQGGDDGSVVVALKLREHREPKETKTKVVATETNDKGQVIAYIHQEEMRPTKPTEKTHKVIPGDTLWAIAQRKLGNGARYHEIAALNDIADPNRIFPGQVLRL